MTAASRRRRDVELDGPVRHPRWRNTLERAGLTGPKELDSYVEPATNFSQPQRAAWYRHLPIGD